MSARLGASLVVVGLGGCVLIDNPSHLALSDEAESSGESTSMPGESSESLGTEAGDATLGTSESSDTAASETDADCPPGTLGCPCEGDACASELVCVEGVCALPIACTVEDPSVIVELDSSEGPSGDTYLGLCDINLSVDAATLIGQLDCALGINWVEFTITPYLPAEQPADFLGNGAATVLLRIDGELGSFARIVLESGPELWLVEAVQLDSGDQDVTTYPIPLAPALGDCVPTPEVCGASQRRALSAADLIVFDGSVAAPAADVRLWVDEARSVCGVDSYRHALIAY